MVIIIDCKTYQSRKEYLETVSNNIKKITGKKINIIYKPNDNGNHNGDALGIKKITIKGQWGDFTSDINEKYRLYYVIGHELGHKDYEPLLILPLEFPIMIFLLIASISVLCSGDKIISFIILLMLIAWFIKFYCCEKNHCIPNRFDIHWNHLREIRADYCGILFAIKYIEYFESQNIVSREELVNIVFPECEDKGGLISISHPAWKTRRECQITEPVFNSDSLKRICEKILSCGRIETAIICKFALNGKLFILPNNEITKIKKKHG